MSVAEENELEDEYEVEEDGYGVDEEEEDTNLMKLNQNEQFANEVVWMISTGWGGLCDIANGGRSNDGSHFMLTNWTAKTAEKATWNSKDV